MAVSAIFYGRSKGKIVGDITLSIYESLLGSLPMLIISKVIQGYRPKQSNQKKRHEKTTTKDIELALSVLHSQETITRIDEGENMDTNENKNEEKMIDSLGIKQSATDKNGNNKMTDIQHTNRTLDDYDDDVYNKLRELDSLRDTIYKEQFKFWEWCREFTIAIIVLWSLGCAIITSIYCIYFELDKNGSNSISADSTCKDSIDISEKLYLSKNASEAKILSLLAQSYTNYHPSSSDSFGDLPTANRFILQVFLSFVESSIIWSPLILYLQSFIKVLLYYRNPSKMKQRKKLFDQQQLIDVDILHNATTRKATLHKKTRMELYAENRRP